MPLIWKGILSSFLMLAVSSLFAQVAAPASRSYHHSVALADNGKPFLQLTNDSNLPIAAFFMAEFPSLGMEGRTYYDYYVNQRELPIAPGASIARGLSSFRGSEAKVKAEVRAVLFQDGTAAGDPVWVNAILAQRLHLYDRLLSVHDLLEKQVGTGISREGILQILRTAQSDVEKQSAEDDLRPVDSTVFYGAISTLDKNPQVPVEVVLQRYLTYLRHRITQLDRSHPTIESIRALPIHTPRPLSDASLPADLRAARDLLASKRQRSPHERLSDANTAPASLSTMRKSLLGRSSLTSRAMAVPQGQLSFCTAGFFDVSDNEPSGDHCPDSDNTGYLGYTDTDYNSLTTTFTKYDAPTGATTYPVWSWSPGPNDLKVAMGTCAQYSDCDGANDVFFRTGTVTGQGAATSGGTNTTVYQGQNSLSFWWLYDDYLYPAFSACDQCDPYPDGQENPNSTNTPQKGIVFYFDYSCAVTPQ